MTPGAVRPAQGGALAARVAPHLSLEVPEVVAVGEPDDGYPFPWAVVAGSPARTPWPDGSTPCASGWRLGRFVTELQGIDMPTRHHRDPKALAAGCRSRGRTPLPPGLAAVRGPRRRRRVARPGTTRSPPRSGMGRRSGCTPTCPAEPPGAGRRLAGVLDFGTIATGDPAYDVTPAWHVLDRASRREFLEIVGPDEATWRRARRPCPVLRGDRPAVLPPHEPHHGAVARRGIHAVLAEDRSRRRLGLIGSTPPERRRGVHSDRHRLDHRHAWHPHLPRSTASTYTLKPPAPAYC